MMSAPFMKRKQRPLPLSLQNRIQQLKDHQLALEKRERDMEKQAVAIREEVKVKLRQKNRERALLCIKGAKMYDKEVLHINDQRANLHVHILELEEALSGNTSSISSTTTMVASRKSLLQSATASAVIDIDEVTGVMIDITDIIQRNDQVNEALSQQIGSQGWLGEDELKAELNEMERQLVDQELVTEQDIPAQIQVPALTRPLTITTEVNREPTPVYGEQIAALALPARVHASGSSAPRSSTPITTATATKATATKATATASSSSGTSPRKHNIDDKEGKELAATRHSSKPLMQTLSSDLLAIVGQYLSVQEKVTTLMRLCRRYSSLTPVAFLFDALQLPNSPAVDSCYPLSSLHRIARILSRLSFRYRAQLRNTSTDELLELLWPQKVPLSDSSALLEHLSVETSFRHLQHLSLEIPYPCYDKGQSRPEALKLLFHWAPTSFPVLRFLRVAMGSGVTTWADPVSVRSLTLLPSLRSLLLERVQISIASLLLLACLPLTQLDLEQCWLCHVSESREMLANPMPYLILHPVATSWQVLRLPMTSACDLVVENLLRLFLLRSAEQPDACKRDEPLSKLQELAYKSELTATALHQIASVASLTHLELLHTQTMGGRVVDLSPLWTHEELPALPALRIFVFPRNSFRPWMRGQLQELLQASVTLLIYASQLCRVDLTIFMPYEMRPLLKAVCSCKRLQQLALVWQSERQNPVDQVWQYEEDATNFCALRSLCLHRAPLSNTGLCRLLAYCPALERCALQSTSWLDEEVTHSETIRRRCPKLRHWQLSCCTDPLYESGRILSYRCYCHRDTE